MGRGGKRHRAKDPHPVSAPDAAGHHGRRRRPRAAADRKNRRNRRHALSRPGHQGHRSRQNPRARDFPQPAPGRRTADPRRQEAGRPRTEYRETRQRWCRGWRPRQRRSRAFARLWAGVRKSEGAARLAGNGKGRQPDRDPRPRHSAGLFAVGTARIRSGKAGDAGGTRGLARRAARHHRSTRRQGSRRRRACRA